MTPTIHYEENFARQLVLNPSISRQFLFDVHFEKGVYVLPAPGKDVPFWNHLCIFTYFLINEKSYEAFESFHEQFANGIINQSRTLSLENLNEFFKLCRNHFAAIERIMPNNLEALKILVRMMSPLLINRANMIVQSEAAQLFISILLRHIAEGLQAIWIAIIDSEWASFREGLINLLCIKLHNHNSKEESNIVFDILTKLPEGTRRHELIEKLINLLTQLKCNLSKDQEVILYTLIGHKNLTLEHLELCSSLNAYVSNLTQFLSVHQDNVVQLETKIQIQLDRLLQEKRFPINLEDILFVLKFFNTESDKVADDLNEKAIQKIKFIFETNFSLRSTFGTYLNERNHHITVDEFPLIRDIILRYYNEYVLHDINRSQYLLRTLACRKDRTIDYFINWFKFFLCESNPNWLRYEEIVQQWTDCFAHQPERFAEVIKQIDILMKLWAQVSPENVQRSNFLATHMVGECFRYGNIYERLRDDLRLVQNQMFIDAFKEKFKK
ncbi:unnamed protein product, partial [Adineta ricciae]